MTFVTPSTHSEHDYLIQCILPLFQAVHLQLLIRPASLCNHILHCIYEPKEASLQISFGFHIFLLFVSLSTVMMNSQLFLSELHRN